MPDRSLGRCFWALKPDFTCCSRTLVKLMNFGLQCEGWIAFFVLQLSVRLLENKELRCGLGHVLKGDRITSILLFSLSNYKGWKFALRKAAPFPCEWYTPNQTQALLPSWQCLLGSAVLLLPIRLSRVSCLENETSLNKLLLETIICGSLNVLFASCRQWKEVYVINNACQALEYNIFLLQLRQLEDVTRKVSNEWQNDIPQGGQTSGGIK